MKILHIDNEESITNEIGTFLQIQRYDYESTSNGRKGLKLIKINHYVIVLLDLNMPEFRRFEIELNLIQNTYPITMPGIWCLFNSDRLYLKNKKKL